MDYSSERKSKFACGIVLQVNGFDYYVPVTSYKRQQPDNFLIYAANGKVTSSLRFNYMFPVPKELVQEYRIDDLEDSRYKALVSQELRYCLRNEDTIRKLAERTYRRVRIGKSPALVENSCDFSLLEMSCQKYERIFQLDTPVSRCSQSEEETAFNLNSKPTFSRQKM